MCVSIFNRADDETSYRFDFGHANASNNMFDRVVPELEHERLDALEKIVTALGQKPGKSESNV